MKNNPNRKNVIHCRLFN